MDVVVESLQRRDVKQMDTVTERLFEAILYQRVELPEKRGQCLSRAGWSKYERVLSSGYCRPALSLRVAGFAQRVTERVTGWVMSTGDRTSL